jgi:ADP-dependent phosphofructokinase/glucokinase
MSEKTLHKEAVLFMKKCIYFLTVAKGVSRYNTPRRPLRNTAVTEKWNYILRYRRNIYGTIEGFEI